MGLISGTSMDAIDVAIVEVAAVRSPGIRTLVVKKFAAIPYPPAVRASLLAALDPNGRARSTYAASRDLCALNFALGEAFAAAALSVGGAEMRGVDIIGSHGQTIYHLPDDDGFPGFAPSTLQFGEPAIIAARTGVTCVADFRVGDMALGGSGAPLVPFLDFSMLRDAAESRVALNIGGIANLTLLPAGCTMDEVTAFDVGPGNMLIDLAVSHFTHGRELFDRDGAAAASAPVDPALLAWLLEHPYYQRAAPKTTGREMFGPAYLDLVLARAAELGCGAESVIATLTALSAHAIARAVPEKTQRIVVSGGGAHNPSLMSRLRNVLSKRFAPPPLVSTSDEFGMPVDAKEAMAFALLAVECVQGRPNNVRSATGAAKATVLGKIVPGENYISLMKDAIAG